MEQGHNMQDSEDLDEEKIWAVKIYTNVFL